MGYFISKVELSNLYLLKTYVNLILETIHADMRIPFPRIHNNVVATVVGSYCFCCCLFIYRGLQSKCTPNNSSKIAWTVPINN
jgi:hypothetical protein